MRALIACFVLYIIQPKIDAKTDKSFIIDYDNNQFLKDGKYFRYISAGIHYFRIPRFYWYDRLLKAKALGINTIQTYVAWNRHEEKKGIYNFKDENDLVHFIRVAQSLNLLVILRPGPYIDAEWEFGGFPAWLANDTTLQMRSTNDPRYINYVQEWFAILLTKLKPLLYKNDGPIIAFQVENEYGNYYACDKNYLKMLQNIYENHLGNDVVLFTTDGYTDNYMRCGTTSSIFATIDFGTEISAEDAFKQQRKYQSKGPLVNSEYYTGWLDYWGRPHQTRDAMKIAVYLDRILALNASVNLYMFIGGTNFAFMNGVDLSFPVSTRRHFNVDSTSPDVESTLKRRRGLTGLGKIEDGTKYLISPTSYDYDAPLSEAGDPTEKYYLLRNVISKYTTEPLIPVPPATHKTAYGRVEMSYAYNLQTYIQFMYSNGDAPFENILPLTMENIGQAYGFLLYRSYISKEHQNRILNLTVDNIQDRTKIIIDGKVFTTVPKGYVDIEIPGGMKLELLVENQGRNTYGTKGLHYLPDSKGIHGYVKINGEILKHWQMFIIDDSVMWQGVTIHSQNKRLDRKSQNDEIIEKSKSFAKIEDEMFFIGKLYIDNITDTYLKLTGWSKGQVYINGYNIGRYWESMGPQHTLYVPMNVLRNGENIILIVELDKSPCVNNFVSNCVIEFIDTPILNGY